MSEPSRLYQYGLELYNMLLRGAAGDPPVFKGSMVKAFRDLNVSQTYYSKLYRTLEELGCIEVVRSGRGGGRPSEILLHRPPEPDEWEGVYTKALTNPTPLDTMRQRLETVERRLGEVDIGSVLVNHNERIETLEREVRKFNGTSEK